MYTTSAVVRSVHHGNKKVAHGNAHDDDTYWSPYKSTRNPTYTDG